uniref:Transcriptional regulator ATRX n=1 Tax=Prolemur simus TaxID=1328070 RepID=A0A8C9AQI0_PROSS
IESKLNTLVQKLHDFLAHSSEESEETSSPPRLPTNQSTDKISGSGNNSDMMENNKEEGTSSSEKFKSSGSSRSKRLVDVERKKSYFLFQVILCFRKNFMFSEKIFFSRTSSITVLSKLFYANIHILK